MDDEAALLCAPDAESAEDGCETFAADLNFAENLEADGDGIEENFDAEVAGEVFR